MVIKKNDPGTRAVPKGVVQQPPRVPPHDVRPRGEFTAEVPDPLQEPSGIRGMEAWGGPVLPRNLTNSVGQKKLKTSRPDNVGCEDPLNLFQRGIFLEMSVRHLLNHNPSLTSHTFSLQSQGLTLLQGRGGDGIVR